MSTTTDLQDFGFRELRMAAELLTAYCDNAPEWLGDGVHIMMNQNSGNVFLTDEDFNVAMMHGDRLDAWLFTPHDGHEGFIDDLLNDHDPADWELDDLEYMQSWSETLGIAFPPEWQLAIDCADDPEESDLHQRFEDEILPFIVAEYEKDGIPDLPARREAFNNWTDSLCKDGEISEYLYETIGHPPCND